MGLVNIKNKTVFKCSNCGYESSKWVGRCPECDSWNTFEEREIQNQKNARSASARVTKPIVKLTHVKAGNSDRIVTGISEFNRVMGGGIVKDSITIITAKPGAGKSTLLLQVAGDVASKGLKVLYASGEESESQIKSRADRIFSKIQDNVWVYSDNSMDNVLSVVAEVDPELLIVDSIQTFVLEGFPGSRAGSPTQTMECANELLKLAKDPARPRAVFLVGQMNKSEEIAGLRALEHLVDAVLILDGDNEEELRGLSVSKNRFGSTWERGYFSMTENGLESIDNPSEYFMTTRDKNERVSGSALTVVKDGSRPIIVEIESLVSKTYTPFPSRIGECVRREQLNTLISILEQRGKISLYDKDVVIKTTGGLKFKETAVNLSIIMSIVSSVFDKEIPNDAAFIADVGLTGELKKVPSLELRIRELDRRGFRHVYVAKGALIRALDIKNIKIHEVKSIQEVIGMVFK
ncbi:DNA repair protein RadA [Ruminiclostridium papyrosolvens DSM 2782]|uniref:DNA repair protein RadA n=1 Tax=Ruminiclostridium papyrosolvens DSM 2782 TaxID=588581 RepID=F1TDX7_9FIRM|nr:DNA repair protein RadA [Ruminiclostridium papyrosolvens]EGD47423.1 DNA repair protein RadA [Ruminiclostridium papyrosolvens DSM 2782]WES34765.1 DNA repair protein RadA [Ruminiclostridium papyrosolvens DSM 2782]